MNLQDLSLEQVKKMLGPDAVRPLNLVFMKKTAPPSRPLTPKRKDGSAARAGTPPRRAPRPDLPAGSRPRAPSFQKAAKREMGVIRATKNFKPRLADTPERLRQTSAYNPSTANKERAFDSLFRHYDKDGDGLLDRKEVIAMIQHVSKVERGEPVCMAVSFLFALRGVRNCVLI